MKIRSGFVSNSSSSSFVIIGKRLDSIKSITKSDLKRYKEIVAFPDDLYGDEGTVLLHISDAAMLDSVQKNAAKLGIRRIYGAFESGHEEFTFNVANLPQEKLEVVTLVEDQNSPTNVAGLKEFLDFQEE